MITNWHQVEKLGWGWSIGMRPQYGGYYAQVFRTFKKRQWCQERKRWIYGECLTEGGKTIAEAQSKLWQRLEQVIE